MNYVKKIGGFALAIFITILGIYAFKWVFTERVQVPIISDIVRTV